VTDYAGLHVFDANHPSSTTSRPAPAGTVRWAPRPKAPCSCATRPTTTPTRTAGAAANR
jgi:hypothetical protein